MEKCPLVKLFLSELGKILDKFQINWNYRTQVMAKLVDLTHFWTVYKDARASFRIRMKLEFWPE